jgi:sec-independent protein translocase protein TatA
MDFQGIGAGEILLIVIVALLIWGPNRIVQIGRTLGKTVHSFKKAASDMTIKLEKEVDEHKKESSKEPLNHG